MHDLRKTNDHIKTKLGIKIQSKVTREDQAWKGKHEWGVADGQLATCHWCVERFSWWLLRGFDDKHIQSLGK